MFLSKIRTKINSMVWSSFQWNVRNSKSHRLLGLIYKCYKHFFQVHNDGLGTWHNLSKFIDSCFIYYSLRKRNALRSLLFLPALEISLFVFPGELFYLSKDALRFFNKTLHNSTTCKKILKIGIITFWRLETEFWA